MPNKPKLYRYPLILEIWQMIGKFVGIALLLLIVLAIAKYLPNYQTITERIKIVLVLILSIFLIMFGVNFYPRIKVDENGLQVEFLWRWLRLEWKDIDGIRTVYTPLGVFVCWMVKSRKLTRLHRLYGLFVDFEFVPCFLIYPRMNNHLELIYEIKQHLKKHSS